MLTYTPLTLVRRETIAEDAVVLEFAAPSADAALFRFQGGQHIPVRAIVDGQELRRTYSIVSPPGGPLTLGVRLQGAMSRYLAHLPIGATVEAMPPTGRFRAVIDPMKPRTHVAFAAGSGITPVLSILSTVLTQEPEARVVLYYGNRTLSRTMFSEALLALKNRYLDRFTVHFVMSQEQQDVERQFGRLNAATARALIQTDLEAEAVAEWYLCGPDAMVSELKGLLTEMAVPGRVHQERFGTSQRAAAPAATVPTASVEGADIVVTMDGRERRFGMGQHESILAAGEAAGLRLPFSCRAGICSTCRARVTQGTVTMDRNQALEEWEVAAGYVLCCQARPTSASVRLTYDET
jgi:ring-1,2-phenylacetyl-CoA epoxidase subunit PaaE